MKQAIPQTFYEWYTSVTDGLSGIYNKREASAISRILLEEQTGRPAHEWMLARDGSPSPSQAQSLQDSFNQLLTGKPLQYVLGYTDFMGMRLQLTPDTLIPRPETEELVTHALQNLPHGKVRVLDAGTGSGCIALAIAHERPGAVVTGIDISRPALAVAQANAQAHGLANTRFFYADISKPETIDIGADWDMIVSNPPYVPKEDKHAMHSNVIEHEPHEALFCPGDEPIFYYHCLAKLAEASLKKNGHLLLEIHEAFGDKICHFLTQNSLSQCQIFQDINDKNRVIQAIKT